ncbi:ankyrin repeat domain-containing protein 9-like [Bombina bombina]|uniref:ankyrin repeat domain-containing protein 9-like n=1 Tax=Bombina bombina TaxID=8345 RepID=UPI00235AF7C3|nr:ankyrin repeat domain-containing protein 9-like [Bombina bombina]
MCSNQASLQDEQCKFYSYMFYQAVRDKEPVWKLEEMRTMEYFHWEDDASLRCYSPSDALMYAVVHNHLRYAQYLLSHFPEEALKVPGIKFCCCPPSAPHLALAVTYDRRDILIMIIKMVHEFPNLHSYINRASCFHLSDGKTPLHLACELLSPATVLILLGNGASSRIGDRNGETPLDVILEQLWSSKVNTDSKKLCLEYLLLFSPSLNFKMRKMLRDNPGFWTPLLGEDKFHYLVGIKPATLYLTAMQKVLQCLHPSNFPQSIQALPIPHSLKPLPGLH